MTAHRQARNMRIHDCHVGHDAESMRRSFIEKLHFELAKFAGVATENDHYLAIAHAVRDRVMQHWVRSARTYLEEQRRTVIYLSAEYLIGPQLGQNMLNLGLERATREALESLGLELESMLEHEEEPGLGNGGLGRLAACFMESLATLDFAAIGHGIRYEFGIFDQEIRDGWQIERTDRWLRKGYPWELRRYEIQLPVGYGGRVEHFQDEQGKFKAKWIPDRVVLGVPYDTPVPGYATGTANFLRLWSAVAEEEFDLDAFQVGEYWRAVGEKIHSENITKVLYPNDSSAAGKRLRLEQQYFFVSCALQDCIRLLLQRTTIEHFSSKYAVQLNDTHPALAVPELLRLLLDVYGMSWDQAWKIVRETFSYTNHTLLPEALETWPMPLFAALLPRHLELIYEINRRFLEEVRARFPGDHARLARMSLIDERGEKSVRMAHLATVASHTINGVAALHSRLLQETVLRDFAELYPERFTNVTNGVTPRRFIAQANPTLASLLTEVLGEGWLTDLDRLKALEPFAEDAAFRARWRAIKRENKESLSRWIRQQTGRGFSASHLLDAQCKRLHEYKRQHLNLLHAAWLYWRILQGDRRGMVPRTILLAGKAAPSYRAAKLLLRLATAISEKVALQPAMDEWLTVVFAPDFNVKNAQRIYPAADLSEQISTAGKEASGTGNMKFAMNGALTIGTLDGANIELRDAVGAENFFLFGLTVEEISKKIADGYHPETVLSNDEELVQVLALLESGHFTPSTPELFVPIVQTLRTSDPYFVLADFRSYVACQERVSAAWKDEEAWARASILNVARSGFFSSDRSIREYASKVWRIDPIRWSERHPAAE